MQNCQQNKMGREEVASTIKWNKILKEDKQAKDSKYLFTVSWTRQMNQNLHFSWCTCYEENRKVRVQAEHCHLEVPENKYIN